MKTLISKYRKGLLYKYFISYLLIFLLPFLILTSALYYFSVVGMKQQLKTTNLNNLRQVETVLSDRLSELENISDNIQLNPRLSNFMLSHPYYSIEGRAELSKLQASNALISEAFIHYGSNDQIFSSNGTQTLSSLTEKKYARFSLESSSLLTSFESKTANLKVSHSDKEGRGETLLQYYRPLLSGGTVYGTAFFFLQESEIARMLDNIVSDYDGGAMIVDSKNQIISSSKSSNSQEQINQVFDLELLKKGQLIFQKKKYHLSSIVSEKSGLTFVTMINAKQFLQPLSQVRNWFYILTLGFLFMGLILSYLMSIRQYKPIKKLDNAFRKISNQEEKTEEDELVVIEKRLSNFVRDHLNLNETISQQQKYLVDDFFNKLIDGKYEDENYVRTRMAELGITFEGNQYFVMLMDTFFSENKEENVKKKTVLLSDFPIKVGPTVVYGVELPLNNQLALIVSFSEDLQNQDKLVMEVQKMMGVYLEESAQLDVGECYDQLVYLNRSYIEAISANEFHRNRLEQGVFFYRDIVYQEPQFLSIPSDLKTRLTQSLQQGDQVVATETIKKVFTEPSLKAMSAYESKFFYFDALSTVINSVSQLGFSDLLDNFNEIVEYQSPASLCQELIRLIEKTCQNISAKKITERTQLESAIIIYLKANYRSHDLSLEGIAVEFDFSLSYLSRFIKEETGVTFSNYIQKMRLSYIKKQLVTTDLSIKEIVLSAGYYDVSNYTRKFKNIVGITPGQYRKNMGSDSVNV